MDASKWHLNSKSVPFLYIEIILLSCKRNFHPTDHKFETSYPFQTPQMGWNMEESNRVVFSKTHTYIAVLLENHGDISFLLY